MATCSRLNPWPPTPEIESAARRFLSARERSEAACEEYHGHLGRHEDDAARAAFVGCLEADAEATAALRRLEESLGCKPGYYLVDGWRIGLSPSLSRGLVLSFKRLTQGVSS